LRAGNARRGAGGGNSFDTVRQQVRELYDALEHGQTRPVYLLSGHDDFQRETVLRRLLSRLVPADYRDTSLTTFDGESAKLGAVAAELDASGFRFDDAPRRVVLVRDCRFAAEADLLVARLESGLAPDVCLVMEVRGAVDRRTKLVKLVEKSGLLLDFPALANDDDAMALLRPRVERAGKMLTRSAVALLVERCGLDAQRLVNETEKLIAYVGRREEITTDDIRLMVAATAELSVFDLVDAVAQRQPRQALDQLEGLLAQQADEFMILAMLIRQFRLLLQARWLLDTGRVDPKLLRRRPFEFHQAITDAHGGTSLLDTWKASAAGLLPPGKQALLDQHYFPLWKTLDQAQHFRTPALAAGFERLLQTDLGLKSTHLKPEHELECLVADLCTRLDQGATVDLDALLEL
jgi:DNA polymerase-3 subunit delta